MSQPMMEELLICVGNGFRWRQLPADLQQIAQHAEKIGLIYNTDPTGPMSDDSDHWDPRYALTHRGITALSMLGYLVRWHVTNTGNRIGTRSGYHKTRRKALKADEKYVREHNSKYQIKVLLGTPRRVLIHFVEASVAKERAKEGKKPLAKLEL